MIHSPSALAIIVAVALSSSACTKSSFQGASSAEESRKPKYGGSQQPSPKEGDKNGALVPIPVPPGGGGTTYPPSGGGTTYPPTGGGGGGTTYPPGGPTYPPGTVIPGFTQNPQNPTQTEFGGPQDTISSFHIGNGRYKDGSCIPEIDRNPLAGAGANFPIQVLQANTNAVLKFEKVCGIDYNTSNFLTVFDSNGRASSQIPVVKSMNGSFSVSLKGLAPGVYYIQVYSFPNGGAQTAGDRDDFIIGHLRVQADKPVAKARAFPQN